MSSVTRSIDTRPTTGTSTPATHATPLIAECAQVSIGVPDWNCRNPCRCFDTVVRAISDGLPGFCIANLDDLGRQANDRFHRVGLTRRGVAALDRVSRPDQICVIGRAQKNA